MRGVGAAPALKNPSVVTLFCPITLLGTPPRPRLGFLVADGVTGARVVVVSGFVT